MTELRELKSDLDVLDYAREVIIRHRQGVEKQSHEDRNLLNLLFAIGDIRALLVHDGKVTLGISNMKEENSDT